jgi:hypothetical protein
VPELHAHGQLLRLPAQAQQLAQQQRQLGVVRGGSPEEQDLPTDERACLRVRGEIMGSVLIRTD